MAARHAGEVSVSEKEVAAFSAELEAAATPVSLTAGRHS